MIRKHIVYIVIVTLMLTLTSCSGRLFTVYKIDVQQGNKIEPEKVEQLSVGMNKEQVKYLMGTPLIIDAFHPDRWDYVYHLIPDYGDTERRHVAVIFDGDIVSEIKKSDIPPVSNQEPEEAQE